MLESMQIPREDNADLRCRLWSSRAGRDHEDSAECWSDVNATGGQYGSALSAGYILNNDIESEGRKEGRKEGSLLHGMVHA
jgi:hypothetical protein